MSIMGLEACVLKTRPFLIFEFKDKKDYEDYIR